jgi:hypothetical protein
LKCTFQFYNFGFVKLIMITYSRDSILDKKAFMASFGFPTLLLRTLLKAIDLFIFVSC